jgi:hypothetical protein
MDVKTVNPVIAGMHLSGFSDSERLAIQRQNGEPLFPRIAASLNGRD